ncbi:MAG: hypothetical protein NUV91_09200, partial [Candidatus Omnitrophica bacterium]|nr:hypothetical protein [Candidatus Omnitrophota bacterium]
MASAVRGEIAEGLEKVFIANGVRQVDVPVLDDKGQPTGRTEKGYYPLEALNAAGITQTVTSGDLQISASGAIEFTSENWDWTAEQKTSSDEGGRLPFGGEASLESQTPAGLYTYAEGSLEPSIKGQQFDIRLNSGAFRAPATISFLK